MWVLRGAKDIKGYQIRNTDVGQWVKYWTYPYNLLCQMSWAVSQWLLNWFYHTKVLQGEEVSQAISVYCCKFGGRLDQETPIYQTDFETNENYDFFLPVCLWLLGLDLLWNWKIWLNTLQIISSWFNLVAQVLQLPWEYDSTSPKKKLWRYNSFRIQ